MITPVEIQRIVTSPAPVILDAGCNDGEHTQMFLDLFPQARVYSFEPDPRARDRFRVIDSRAQLFAMALGAVDDVMPFYQSDGWPGGGIGWDLSGSILKPKNHLKVHPWCTFDAQIDVLVMRLDTWAAQNGVREIDFIWADVQGAEGNLIAGGRETLAHTRYFYTEFSDAELYEGQPMLDELRAMLPDFEVAQVYPNDVLFRNLKVSC